MFLKSPDCAFKKNKENKFMDYTNFVSFMAIHLDENLCYSGLSMISQTVLRIRKVLLFFNSILQEHYAIEYQISQLMLYNG